MKPRTQRWLFNGHMCAAGGCMVLGMAAGAAHLVIASFINAALFGFNLAMAWVRRP